MQPLIVVAKVVAKKESVETVKAELLKLVAPTRSEEGCLTYILHQDNADPAVFVFYEIWSGEACLARHMESAHFISYVAAIEGMIEEKVINQMTRIE